MAWNGTGTRRPRRRHGEPLSEPSSANLTPARGGPRKPPGSDDSWDALSRELDRSRRYRHPLTLVRMVGDQSSGHRTLTARARREGRPAKGRAASAGELVAQLRGLLRSGDCAWSDHGAVYVLLPETNAPGAAAMIARARTRLPALAGATELRYATFPEHGLTAQALRAAVTPPREGRFGPAMGDLEWRGIADRVPGRNGRPGPMAEGAD
jgi:hypothetical protein